MKLQIPTPCAENWSAMDPVEKGRHCAACQKTVIDFTGMSDAEVVRTISQAGAHVCGRLAPDQLDRKLSDVPPVQRNGASGWNWFFAGLLLTADPPTQHRSQLKGMVVTALSEEKKQVPDTSIVMGMPFTKRTVVKRRPVYLKDTSAPTMGTPAIASDAEAMAIQPAPDSIALPKAPDSCVRRPGTYVGGIGVRVIVKTDTISLFKQIVADTLAGLGLLPKKEFSVYPNPVQRGASFRIVWNATPGSYQLVLYSAAGMLVKEKLVEVGFSNQIDPWESPPGITGGSYVIRAVRADGSVAFSRILLVL